MTAAPRHFRYSRQALHVDYLRAAAGIAMCAVLILLATPLSWAFWAFNGFLLVFAAFALNIAFKHLTRLDIDGSELRRILDWPGGAVTLQRLNLAEIDLLRLRYFGRRRPDRRKGIIELRLGAGGQRLIVDQSLEGFDDLVSLAEEAAERCGLVLDAATEANLSALGFQ